MEKGKDTTNGSCCFVHCRPAGPRKSTPASSAFGSLLRLGVLFLIAGAVFMLCVSVATSYLWKASEKNVYNVHYRLNIDGEVRDGSMDIDSDNNLERFKTGSGAGEAVEIHDFQIGITGIRFFGEDKCYIKSQIKANLPLMHTLGKDEEESDLVEEMLPVHYDKDFLIWVAAEPPLNDTSFLSSKIMDLCGELPVFWLQSVYPKDGERRKRDTLRAKRQINMEEMETAAVTRKPANRTKLATSRAQDEEGSASGSAHNPENPYHRSGEASEESAMTFDSMLDHQGICCSACQRGYTHCQRVCEPLRGYWPWPYNYRGCQVACRIVMPCRWWVARILGYV